MKFKTAFCALLAVVVVASCDSGFRQTDSGLEYKIIVGNTDAVRPETGDIVALRVTCRSMAGTIVDEKPLFKMQLRRSTVGVPSIEEGLALMHKGDSVVFRLTGSQYYQTPASDTDSLLNVSVKLVDIIPFDDFQRDREAARIAGEREEDQLLAEFLEREKIDVEPTMSGLYYIEMRKGDGPVPMPGKNVTIHYEGYFINGRVFDSSYRRNEPLTFKLGAMQVIQGLEEGVARMRIGGKSMLIIPSPLAYGDRQTGPIPPFATLIFEVELVAVE